MATAVCIAQFWKNETVTVFFLKKPSLVNVTTSYSQLLIYIYDIVSVNIG